MTLLIVAVLLSFVASSFGDHTHFRPLDCRGETFKTGLGLRLYTSWTEIQGVNMSDTYTLLSSCQHAQAKINGQYFSRPTRCVKDRGFRAEFDVKDKTCSVDHSWLFEKIGGFLAKDIRCVPRSNSDGCTAVSKHSPYYDDYYIRPEYLNALCVTHDICYTIPASFGYTKDICDEMTRITRWYGCMEHNEPECATLPFFSTDADFSQSAYDKAQEASSSCSLTVKQRESSLYQGDQMDIGSTRWSPNGRYLLTLQSDGNLVIYRKPSNRAVWSSQTQGRGVDKAVMQYDGNFVLYTAEYAARWHTGTDLKPANFLLLQDDGNLVIYSMGSPTSMWASKVHTGYLLPMSTNLRTESFNSTSIEDISTMTMQEDLPDPPVDIVHFDRDPNSAGTGAGVALREASNLEVDGLR